MKKFFLFCVFIILVSFNLFAGTANFDAAKMFSVTKVEAVKSKDGTTLGKSAANMIKTMSITKSFADNIFLSGSSNLSLSNFPINTLENSTITLKAVSSAVDAETQWLIETKEGVKQIKGPNVVCYSGEIAGAADTKVFLSYINGSLYGYVRSNDGLNYDISTLPKLDEKGRKQISVTEQNYKFREDPTLAGYIDRDNAVEFTSTEFDDMPKSKEYALGKNSKLYECKIGIDAINNFFVLMGSDTTRTAEYIAAIMSHVSTLYEEYVNVKITLPFVLIRTDGSTDPYKQKELKSFDDILPYMSTVWSSSSIRPSKTALVAMFASLYDQPSENGGRVGGLSYGGNPGVGSLCNLNYGYSIFGMNGYGRYPNYNYTWDVSVAAHELGHSFGSPHTHTCYYTPPIDTCVTQTAPMGGIGDACLSGTPVPATGTIMSYCHLTNRTGAVELRFHPREVNNMRKAAASAQCIYEPAAPVIDILSPLVDNDFVSGDIIPVRWTSSKVNYVNLYYTTDNGISWEPIASNIPANDSLYNWTAPRLTTQSLLVKVTDNTDETIFAISNSPVSIGDPVLSFTTPAAGSQYNRKEKMDILWKASGSKKFNCYFSSNSGSSWTLVEDNNTSKSVQYDLPDVISSNCFIKIIDVERPSIIKVSPKFSIGEGALSLTDPLPGDTICASYPHKIKWNSQYVHSVVIMYSTDKGENWSNVSDYSINANLQSYSWSVPKIKSDDVLIKVIMRDDTLKVLSESKGSFAIDTCVVSGIRENYEGSSVAIVSVSPNPVIRSAELRFTSNETVGNTEISVLNINGQTVLTKNNAMTVPGENRVSLDLSGLAPGKYFISVKAGQAILHYPVTIVR